MDGDELGQWRVYSLLAVLFSCPRDRPQRCIVCSKTSEFTDGSLQSLLWREGTQCSGGHRPTEQQQDASEDLWVCDGCEQAFTRGLVEGTQPCRFEGCERMLRLDADVVEEWLDGHDLPMGYLDAVFKLKGQTVECIVCFDEMALGPDVYGAAPPTQECNHDRNVCDDCLKTTYETAIQGGQSGDDLTCPDPSCRAVVSMSHLRQTISSDCFKAYTRALTLKAIARTPNFRWCTCGSGQIHSPGESNAEWICIACGKTHCFLCRDNTGAPCEHLREIQITRKDDRRRAAEQVLAEHVRVVRENVPGTLRQIALTTKMCPKAGCRTRIERDHGCAHFRCRNCSTEFCWCCKVIFEGGTGLHLDTCRLGTRSTISRDRLNTAGYTVGWDVDDGYDTSRDTDLWIPSNYM